MSAERLGYMIEKDRWLTIAKQSDFLLALGSKEAPETQVVVDLAFASLSANNHNGLLKRITCHFVQCFAWLDLPCLLWGRVDYVAKTGLPDLAPMITRVCKLGVNSTNCISQVTLKRPLIL